jgi:hypothetical protein
VIWLLAHPLPPSPVSKLSLFFCLPVCRCPSSLTGEVGRDWGRSRIIRLREAWCSINHSILGININLLYREYLCDVTGANAHHGEGTLTSDSAAVLLERGTRPFLSAAGTVLESRPGPPDHMSFTGKGGHSVRILKIMIMDLLEIVRFDIYWRAKSSI